MDKKRIEQIVVGVLLLITAVFAYRQIAPWVFPKKARSVPVTQMATQPQDSASEVVEMPIPQLAAFQLGRDPFWPSDDVAILLGLIEPPKINPLLVGLIDPPELVVQGLVWSTTRPQAIVNDKVVTIGDEIAGAFVRQINRSGITVEYRGQEFVISPLPPSAVRGGGG